MKPLTPFATREAAFAALAEVVANELRTALAAKGQATLAVPGGTTPAPFFERLRGVDLDWAQVRVMLTDERFVPETSVRSNTRLLRQSLLQDHAAKAQFVPMYLPADRPEDVLDALTQAISAAMPLDVCVLGMGVDMHTASLFPGADQLARALARDAPVLLAMRAPGAPEPRMTLSATALRSANDLHLLFFGSDKRAAFAQACQDGPVGAAPVRAVLDRATVFYAD